MIADKLTIGLGIGCAVLGLALAGVTNAYLGARDERATAVSERDDARGAASTCSDGVDDLLEEAEKRKKRAEPERRAAAAGLVVATADGQRILTAPQKVAGNTCASAQAEVDEFFSERDSK